MASPRFTAAPAITVTPPVDRLSQNARAIRAAAISTAPVVVGPYTRAVLHTNLGDLIRDIDPSELGLFGFTPTISRAQFTPTTPLRKVLRRRDDAVKECQFGPDTYARAAIQCIDRYELIRPMPRARSQAADILMRVECVRRSIEELHMELAQTQSASEQPINSLISSEESRVDALQLCAAELMRRKQDVISKRNKPAAAVQHSQAPVTPPHTVEDQFWNTPGTGTGVRTFHLADNLIDEAADFGDISASFASPLPRSASFKCQSIEGTHILLESPTHDTENGKDLQGNSVDAQALSTGDTTVSEDVLAMLEPLPLAVGDNRTDVVALVEREAPSKQPKIHVNSEIERCVAKIWTTVADTIMPGHPYVATGCAGSIKPPRAKETIAHLRSLSSLSLSPSSPSVSSVSSLSATVLAAPTTHQILTACLLLSLLSSPPHFSLPLNEIKNRLVAKAGIGSTTIIGQGTTRIIYGCVAKRLIKIERGKGEQVVKFDI